MTSERTSESGEEWGFEVKRGYLSHNQFVSSSAQSGESLSGREERKLQEGNREKDKGDGGASGKIGGGDGGSTSGEGMKEWWLVIIRGGGDNDGGFAARGNRREKEEMREVTVQQKAITPDELFMQLHQKSDASLRLIYDVVNPLPHRQALQLTPSAGWISFNGLRL